MDPITALLDGPRARGAFVLRCLLQSPWSMAIRDEAPLTLLAVVRGDAWIAQHGVVVHAAAGTVALVTGPGPYVVSSTPMLAPQIVIHPDQRCETLDGRPLDVSMRLGVRSWGHGVDTDTALLVGTYEHHSVLASAVLGALPSPLVVARPPEDPLLQAISAEVVNEMPGQQTLLDRLLDALTVDTLRRWYVTDEAGAPAWWRSHDDPIVGEVLELIHDRPDEAWTIESLARKVGTSRANLARRFREQVGEPVIGYLTTWRLSLGADLLAEPGRSIGGVAQEVGYGSAFAFSTAFKRRYGISPNRHRQLARSR